MVQVFTTSQHVLRVLQTSISSFIKFIILDSLAREEEDASCSPFWKLKELTLFVGENAQITGIYG